MAETINMPKLGFDMAEGTLVRWVKKTGESVKKGEVLAEIETDKATVEVESSASGIVRKLLVDEGAVVPVNSPIAVVGTAEEKIEEVAPQASQPSKVESQPAPVAQPSTDSPIPATSSNTAPVVEAAPVTTDGSIKASPLAKKIARDQSLNLANINGSGPGGRIVRRDIEAAASSGQTSGVLSATSLHVKPPAALKDETVQLSKLRQAIARRMAESKASIPHFYVTHEYNVDRLMDLRAQFNKILPESEKTSVNDFVVKAVALTLLQFPNLNASLSGSSVIHHGQINIGIAVSVEGGLLTIVCRDAEQKPLRQISAEVKAMAARTRDGKVKPDDIEGSTFSISNMGMYDVENFAAIINPPEAAILAVGSARQAPVVEDGELKVGWRMKATISVDHRVSDGVEAARFMQALAISLEEPLRLVV
jgi:pyruvate dehydrogenase E2 component (dihydrolipoamide acetyltransferase)